MITNYYYYYYYMEVSWNGGTPKSSIIYIWIECSIMNQPVWGTRLRKLPSITITSWKSGMFHHSCRHDFHPMAQWWPGCRWVNVAIPPCCLRQMRPGALECTRQEAWRMMICATKTAWICINPSFFRISWWNCQFPKKWKGWIHIIDLASFNRQTWETFFVHRIFTIRNWGSSKLNR